MTELTDDEFTVLLIAQQGESMMPIGRWEKPVESLVQKGFLHRYDKFNNSITTSGKEVAKARSAQEDNNLMQVLGEVQRMAVHDRLARDVFDFCKSHPSWEGSTSNERRAYLKLAIEWIAQRVERFI